MTFSRLVDFIRYEARLPGSSTATAFIEETILEVLRDLTAIDLYQQCLNIDFQLTLFTGGAGTVNLPLDYQHLSADRVRYLPAGVDDDSYFLLESEYFDQPNDGAPSKFRLSKGQIVVFPNNLVTTGDVLKIDYYSAITTLDQDTVFPIASLESAVKKAVIARCKRMTGADGSAMEGDSQQSLNRSKGDGTDNK